MYFIDRDKIEQTLAYMEEMISLFEQQKEWSNELEKLALERIGTTLIESVLDTGNAMIDGFIMRDPGSYDDIIDILEDEKVITEEMSASLKKVIAHRKMLVQEYIAVDHQQISGLLKNELTSLKLFAPHIRDYLTNQLGPVSAFKK